MDGEAEAHYQLALHFQENHRHKLAIDELRQVLQRNPAHVKAYNALGVSYDNLGDHEAAIESYQIALKIDPKLDYIYNNLGYSYLLNGQTAEAVVAFQKAIAINAERKALPQQSRLSPTSSRTATSWHSSSFGPLNSTAGAEKTFAKVMQDLGKGSQTERVLLAARSAACGTGQRGRACPEDAGFGATGGAYARQRSSRPLSGGDRQHGSNAPYRVRLSPQRRLRTAIRSVVAPVHTPGKSVEPVVQIPASAALKEKAYMS